MNELICVAILAPSTSLGFSSTRWMARTNCSAAWGFCLAAAAAASAALLLTFLFLLSTLFLVWRSTVVPVLQKVRTKLHAEVLASR